MDIVSFTVIQIRKIMSVRQINLVTVECVIRITVLPTVQKSEQFRNYPGHNVPAR